MPVGLEGGVGGLDVGVYVGGCVCWTPGEGFVCAGVYFLVR